MVQLIQFTVPKIQFDRSFYVEPCQRDQMELETDFPGAAAIVEELLESNVSLAAAVIEMLEFGGVKAFNALVVTDATNHTIVRLRATRKRSTQLVNLVRRSIGVGVQDGTIDIIHATSMPSFPRSSKLADGKVKKRKGQFFRDDRLTDDAIYEAVDNVSHLTFDYLAMLLVGSLIAGVGLISDSAVTVVASMLVSPLMGPILCIAFGLTVQDATMMCRGLRNEVIGVGLCFGMGALFGFVTGPFYGEDGANKDLFMNATQDNHLVSSEIESRGSLAALLPGFFVAAPSGFGAAMAINTDGANALVGVAISAALLPPLVNCGFCMTFASFGYNDVDEWVTKGLYSGLLFMLNLVCIIIFASLAMRIYRIKPLQSRKAFWKNLRIKSPKKRRTANRLSRMFGAGGHKPTTTTAALTEDPEVLAGDVSVSNRNVAPSGEYLELTETTRSGGLSGKTKAHITPPPNHGRRSTLSGSFSALSVKPTPGNQLAKPGATSAKASSAGSTVTRASSMLDSSVLQRELSKQREKRFVPTYVRGVVSASFWARSCTLRRVFTPLLSFVAGLAVACLFRSFGHTHSEQDVLKAARTASGRKIRAQTASDI